MQTQFTSSKSVKTWAQYLDKKLNLKTWTSQFSSFKSWKTREAILLAISLTGIGAYKIPTQLTYYKRIKTSKTKLEHKTWKSQFSSSKNVKTRETILFINQFDWKRFLHQPKSVFKFQKCKNMRDNPFSN